MGDHRVFGGEPLEKFEIHFRSNAISRQDRSPHKPIISQVCASDFVNNGSEQLPWENLPPQICFERPGADGLVRFVQVKNTGICDEAGQSNHANFQLYVIKIMELVVIRPTVVSFSKRSHSRILFRSVVDSVGQFTFLGRMTAAQLFKTRCVFPTSYCGNICQVYVPGGSFLTCR